MITEQEVWDALPQYGFVRDYVTATSQWTDSHIAHHLSSCLVALTQCVPPWYCVPFANPLYGNMFALAVGSSGSRKTAAINIMEHLVKEVDPSAVAEQPGSTEGLAESLRAQNRQMIIYGEFGDFLSKSEQGYLNAMKAAFTSAWDCLDDQTEILTEKGWKKRGEVQIGDLVYSLNLKAEKIELVPALDVGERSVRPGEKMALTKSMRLNIRTTEGHDYYIKYRNKGKPSEGFLKKKGHELAKRKGDYLLPLAGSPEKDFPGVPLTDDEIRFLGWFITDASMSNSQITISQSKPERVIEIRELLTRIGFDFTEGIQKRNEGTYANALPCHLFHIPKGTGTGARARNGWIRLAEYLDKDIAPVLSQMTREQFQIFWKEALKGNGDNTWQEYESDGLYTSRKEQVDRLMHMAVVRGFSTNYGMRVTDNGVKMYRVVVRDAKYLQTNPGSDHGTRTELVDPVEGEIVWCVSNQNGTLVTRREGRVMILGNCNASGRALANSRRGQVADPRLSVMGGVAVGLLEQHTVQADWTGGFMARFLTFHAEREREFDSPPLPDHNKRKMLINQYKALCDPSLTPGSCLWIQPGSKTEEIWKDWHADMRVFKATASNRAQAACSRATAIAGKVALLLEWDLGGGRSGSDFYISEEAMRSTVKIINLHLKSVIELGEMIASSKDMKDRAAVLRILGNGTLPLGLILKHGEMLKKRGREILDTLIEERMVEMVQIGNETCYRRSPENHLRLVQFAEEVSSGNSSNKSGLGSSQPNMAKVISLPPKPAVGLVPDNMVFEADDDDDVDWSKYDG